MMVEVRDVRDIEEVTVRARVGDQCRYATGADGYMRVSLAWNRRLEAGRGWSTDWWSSKTWRASITPLILGDGEGFQGLLVVRERGIMMS